MAKKKAKKAFKVRIKSPMTQRQVDAVQLKPGYDGHILHYDSTGSTLKEVVLFFEGNEDVIKKTHTALKKLKSKNITVQRITKA